MSTSAQFQTIRTFDETTFAFRLDNVLRTINPNDPAETAAGTSTIVADPALQLVGTPNIAGSTVHYKLKVSSAGKVRDKAYPVWLRLITSSGLKKEIGPMWFTITG